MHSLGIVQRNSTRRDHPGNPGGVSGSGHVSSVGSGNYLEWVSKLMVPGSSPRRRKKPL